MTLESAVMCQPSEIKECFHVSLLLCEVLGMESDAPQDVTGDAYCFLFSSLWDSILAR